jgi:uncharacterized protein YfiM (DUF2279 family)
MLLVWIQRQQIAQPQQEKIVFDFSILLAALARSLVSRQICSQPRPAVAEVNLSCYR